ncbi:MAG: DNA-binding protein [Terriglobia bacterium]
MIAARLNRDKLRLLADSRLKEAEVLLDNAYWTGAYYMTGLAVECALKAYLARAVQQYDFPDKGFVNRAYTHKLKELVQMDGVLWEELQKDASGDEGLESNWNTVLSWNDENRYEMVEEFQAKTLYSAVTDPRNGAMEWIRRRW